MTHSRTRVVRRTCDSSKSLQALQGRLPHRTPRRLGGARLTAKAKGFAPRPSRHALGPVSCQKWRWCLDTDSSKRPLIIVGWMAHGLSWETCCHHIMNTAVAGARWTDRDMENVYGCETGECPPIRRREFSYRIWPNKSRNLRNSEAFF